jgi:histidyl-tRNA synthetase
MKFQNVKGTRDFYPEDLAVRNWLVERWRSVSLRHGLLEYDGPTFEYLDLYKAKSGEAIVADLFHFEDRGGRQLALRPEMTPTLARMVAARAQSLSKPIKWFSVPHFFRAERPQRGRLREFWQWNVDILTEEGEDTLLADVECIFVALDLLREIGLAPSQVEMRINSRVLLAEILVAAGLPEQAHGTVYAVLDKRDKLPPEVFEAELKRLNLAESQLAALIELGRAPAGQGLEAVQRLTAGRPSAAAALGRLQEVMSILNELGIGAYCHVDFSVVRGLAYYTDLVFEAFSTGTLRRAILGGGRYGQLLESLGGPPLSGVGFGMGDVILVDQLGEMGLLPQALPGMEFFVATDGDVELAQIMRAVALVRQRGHSCGLSYRRGALKKQLQQAVSHNAAHVIILSQDFASGVLRLKNLERGEQVDTSVQEFTRALERPGGVREMFRAGPAVR